MSSSLLFNLLKSISREIKIHLNLLYFDSLERAPKGEVVIFNRSHFVDVLVGRVNKLVEKSVWSKRYDLINDLISTQENQMSFAEQFEAPGG